MVKKFEDMHLDLGAMPEQEDSGPLLLGAALPTLSMDEMKEIELQARAEVEAELKEKLRADYLAKTKSDLKKKSLFVEGSDAQGASLERIQIDLPKFSDRIVIDGTIYFHNGTYSFAPQKAAVIKEIMNRQWMHHAEINGLDINEYNGRKKQDRVLTARDA